MQRGELTQEQIQQRSKRFLKTRSTKSKSGVQIDLPSSQKSIRSFKQQQEILPQKQSKSKSQCMQGWQQHYDPDVDTTYYFHNQSGLAQWTCPKSQKQQQQVLRKVKK